MPSSKPRRSLENKVQFSTGIEGRYYIPNGYQIVRRTFETANGWSVARKSDGSFRVLNDPLGLLVRVVARE